jgi:homocitrate synthase
MCPHGTDDISPENARDMVAIEGTPNSLNGHHAPNGAHPNGQSSVKQRRNPYAPRASDFLNNVSNFKIIESTLRGSCIVVSRTYLLLM